MPKKENAIQIAIEHALQFLGAWPKHIEHYEVEEWDEEKGVVCSQCGHAGKLKIHIKHERFPKHPGRPDLTVPNPRAGHGKGIAYCEMEVKAILKDELRFNFADISEAQYKYMNNWTAAGGDGFAAIGKIIATPHGTTIHSIFVPPWSTLMQVKKKCEEVAETGLPYNLSLYKRPPNGLLNDFTFFFPSWCILAKDEEGEFHFHPEHPIARGLTEVEKPFFKRNK